MSTVIELSEEMARSLQERSREEQVPQEELIRKALASYLDLRVPSFEPRGSREPGPWPELEKVLGRWQNPDGDEAGAAGREAYPVSPDLLAASKPPRQPGDPWPELDAAFGLWKDRGEDTFAYLERIRGE